MWKEKCTFVLNKYIISIVPLKRPKNIVTYILLGLCAIGVLSCGYFAQNDAKTGQASVADTVPPADDLLVSDEELEMENRYDIRGDELFEDFLYSFINDEKLQMQRTFFPLKETLLDGTTRTISKDAWYGALDFMNNEYTTAIYGDEQDKGMNESTTLSKASVEKIDLLGRVITSYDFVREEGKWNLQAIRNTPFSECELNDFLTFYSSFSQDSLFQRRSLARSIRISIIDPENNTQTIEGFITRDQWSTMHNEMPTGVITNIRYGQAYANARRILMEKISIGNGMAETFLFAKNRNRWELVGYEN